jgi:hypothetical protein
VQVNPFHSTNETFVFHSSTPHGPPALKSLEQSQLVQQGATSHEKTGALRGEKPARKEVEVT